MSSLGLFSTREAKISCILHSMPHGSEVTTIVIGTHTITGPVPGTRHQAPLPLNPPRWSFPQPQVGFFTCRPYSILCRVFEECVLVTELCPTLCEPMDYSPPRSSVHGILQARTLEWVATPFSGVLCTDLSSGVLTTAL